ncbi:response regulator [Paenibacillus sp. TRM 82003]|nr:response regulator [Paenibacillus sp. TRM 82003]
MYKVLLVDDERIILEGIANVIEWERHGTTLVGKAVDGAQAWEAIRRDPPHIVITDVKMPEMNGIELIERTKVHYPEIVFIILSGHDEFSSAQSAMKLGVRHYLLKPCNENKIVQVLEEVVGEVKEWERRGAFILHNRERFEKVLPQIKEQFLKECITNKTYGEREWNEYGRLFGLRLDEEVVRMIVCVVDGQHDFEHLFALHNIAQELSEGAGGRIILNTTIGERLALLVEDRTLDFWTETMDEIRRIFTKYYGWQVTIAISESGSIASVRKLYKEALGCLSHRFYLGGGIVITTKDIAWGDGEEEPTFDADAILFAARSGNEEELVGLIQGCFGKIKASKLEASVVKSYVLELYLVLMRHAGPPEDGYARSLAMIESMTALDQAEETLIEAAKRIAAAHGEAHRRTQSKTVQAVVHYLREHLSDETLSLSKLAQDVFHMNADYLGKLFRKETGEKFSNFLLQLRIEEAKRLMLSPDGSKISDVAERVGFGGNVPYFSHVFKRHTGSTPSEYKRASTSVL